MTNEDRMREDTAEELSWQVDGLKITGLGWGPRDGHPVLALHGWLDHADSFAELAPRLTGCRVVALDKPGQGDSDHRARHATYNIWDDIPQVLGVMNKLGWQRCTLMGHSRGAMVCLITAAVRPERIETVIALDALMPRPMRDEEVVAQLRGFLDDMERLSTRGARLYSSRDGFLRRRRDYGNAPEVAERLAHRAIAATDEGFRVKADPRLQAASAIKLNMAQVEAFMRAVTAPVLSIWATGGLTQEAWAKDMRIRAQSCIAALQQIEIEGDHHWHLNPVAAEQIAVAALEFLSRRASS